MKKYLILLAAACTTAACGHTSKTGQHQQPATVETPTPARTVGSYTEQRALTQDERDLFERVTRELAGVKYTPESVATQIVAGVNYRFICKAETITWEPETYQAQITVYQPLPGQGAPKITEIKRL